MIKKIMDKRNYIILFVIIVLIIWVIWVFFNKRDPYIKTFNYYGEKITFKVYDKVDYHDLTRDINNIYKKYEKANEISGKLSEDEKALIEYGKLVYYKTDGYVDITKGNNGSVKSDIESIIIKDDKLVKDIDFNFDDIIGSYATNEVLYYFKQNNIKKYIVSENGDVTCGEYYGSGKYSVSIKDPADNSTLEIVSLENQAMASRYDGEFKGVNPKTGKRENKYDGVVVISNDNLTANMLVNALYLMDQDDGEKLAEDYNSEALWIIDGKIVKTDGFNQK